MLPSNGWVVLFGGLALVALVPIVWAIVDVLRRPPWMFSSGRKVLWVATLVIGWLILWPMALISSLLYLFVFRRRFPVGQPVSMPMATWDPYATSGGGGRPPDLPPAGWYPDPSGQYAERWWDGRGWSDHVR